MFFIFTSKDYTLKRSLNLKVQILGIMADSWDMVGNISKFWKRFGLPDIISDQQDDDQTHGVQEQIAKTDVKNATEKMVGKDSILSKPVQPRSNPKNNQKFEVYKASEKKKMIEPASS